MSESSLTHLNNYLPTHLYMYIPTHLHTYTTTHTHTYTYPSVFRLLLMFVSDIFICYRRLIHVVGNRMTIDENHTLCSTFSKFFVGKIKDLKHSIQAKMSSLTSSSQYPDCPFTGNPILKFLPVTPDEVAKLLSSSTKSSRQDLIPLHLSNPVPQFFFRTHFHPCQPFLLRRHLSI